MLRGRPIVALHIMKISYPCVAAGGNWIQFGGSTKPLIPPPESSLCTATVRRETCEQSRGQVTAAALVRRVCPLHPSDIQSTRELPQARCMFLLSRDQKRSRVSPETRVSALMISSPILSQK